MLYEYDKANRIIKVDDETICLTEVENIIFNELYSSGLPVSAERLNDVLNDGYMFRENTVSTYVSRLRKKLKDKFTIDNVYGSGYVMKYNDADDVDCYLDNCYLDNYVDKLPVGKMYGVYKKDNGNVVITDYEVASKKDYEELININEEHKKINGELNNKIKEIENILNKIELEDYYGLIDVTKDLEKIIH